MAEQKKAEAAADDKSINELLKEYADDVKDKDLDDFLKSDDDAFESDDSETSDEDKSEDTEENAPKKSGGLLTGLLLLVVFAVAGAGTYIYLNRDSGMTAIMGGFMGGEEQVADTLEPVQPQTTALSPDLEPQLPTPTMDAAPQPTDLPSQPLPIANEASAPPMPMATQPSSEEPPAAELLTAEPAVPQPAAPVEAPVAEASPAAPVAAATDAAKAVDAWASGAESSPMMPAADLPVQPVEEVKAQPVKAAPKQEAAPKKAQAQAPSADDALPPPYVAIQGNKGGASAVSTATKAKMQPVVEGSSKSARNANEADVTSATGDYRTMVMQGGGKIEIAGSKTTIMPAGMAPATDAVVPAGVSARPENAPNRLAIAGGKSLPDGYTPPVPMQAATPVVPPAMDAPEIKAPVVEAPVMKAVAQPEGDAKAMLAQALAMEKAGKTGDALELYQRALELDAVYGNGKSIDRGMVYDRIGAIRAGQ
ncbi:MAG: hypothetical protein EBQ96_04035 [Proteobacteria bacterium]|nr:hypothetical protein [Pseudomonadota bacterium]